MRAYAREHRFAAALTVVAFAGLLWRVIYDVMMRHSPALMVGTGHDCYRYHSGALLLAGATKLGLRTWLQRGLFASVIGTATIVMTGLAANVAFGSRPGLIAAALAAGYAGLFFYEREVLSEPLAMLGTWRRVASA